MPSTTNPTLGTLLTATLFVGTLALTLYNRVSTPDYEALVLAIKLLAAISTPTSRTKSSLPRGQSLLGRLSTTKTTPGQLR
jgi:hypothetical protein